MRLPLSWVREFTPLDHPVTEIVSALNQLGLEVEQIDNHGAEVVGVKTVRVLSVTSHPDADRLVLVDIDTGSGATQVVCGASNLVAGMVVPHAGIGAQVPGGLTLASRKIRGQVSEGMLCSALELGLGDDARGILELDPNSDLGIDVKEMLNLDDVILDIAVTPNRPDAMCVIGVARELAAFFGEPLLVSKPSFSADRALDSSLDVTIEESARCPRYYGHRASVTVGPSPAWLRERLVKAGLRSINNVVDVTNYVLLERNQPLHAFDAANLAGPGVIVRLAKDGERITTLDGVERVLENSDLLICDANSNPQALAGIMGGSVGQVTDVTTEIVLEAAYFERMGIARSSKRQKVRTESSARFERGIDPEGVVDSATRALELLVQVAGARVATNGVDKYPEAYAEKRITLRTDRVNRLLGTELVPDDIDKALTPIEIQLKPIKKSHDFECTVPSFRPDLAREVDLIEEVARLIGFSRIGRTVPRPQNQVGGLSARQSARRAVADALVGAGFSEAITVPFVSEAALVGFENDKAVALRNSLSAEEPFLRTSLIPGLIDALRLNYSRGMKTARLFELGAVFHTPTSDQLLPNEPERIGGVLVGRVARRPVEDDRTLDGFDAADAVRVVADALGVKALEISSSSSRTAGQGSGSWSEVKVGATSWGWIAVLNKVSGFDDPVVIFELTLEDQLDNQLEIESARPYLAPSSYPPSTIDLAFELNEDISAGTVLATLRHSSGALLESVELFDEYRSDNLGAGRKSLAFSLRFRASDRTLTDQEVGAVRSACVNAVIDTLGATLRGVE